jgi:hypothetical protein
VGCDWHWQVDRCSHEPNKQSNGGEPTELPETDATPSAGGAQSGAETAGGGSNHRYRNARLRSPPSRAHNLCPIDQRRVAVAASCFSSSPCIRRSRGRAPSDGRAGTRSGRGRHTGAVFLSVLPLAGSALCFLPLRSFVLFRAFCASGSQPNRSKARQAGAAEQSRAGRGEGGERGADKPLCCYCRQSRGVVNGCSLESIPTDAARDSCFLSTDRPNPARARGRV